MYKIQVHLDYAYSFLYRQKVTPLETDPVSIHIYNNVVPEQITKTGLFMNNIK